MFDRLKITSGTVYGSETAFMGSGLSKDEVTIENYNPQISAFFSNV